MKAASANLLSLIKGPKQFVIPIYQRTYSWHQVQCEQLFKDILRISSSEQSLTQGHFVGSVVYFQEGVHTVSDVPKLLVIDGQQRLTTVTLLIAALSFFVKKNKPDIGTNFTKLQNYYLFNAEEDGDLHYKMLLTRRDKQTLIDLLNEVPVTEPCSQRVKENFEFFKNKINNDNVQAVYNGLMRLFVVDVALEKGVDNPQLIFESLNSTGLDLSQADLIRNFILMGLELEQQKDLYNKHWFPMEQSYGNEYTNLFDWFMRDYLSVKTGQITKVNRVHEAFKQFSQSRGAPGDISLLVEDIHHFSNYYVNMVLHKEPNEALNRAFKRISRLKVDVSRPFLLAVYADFANDLVSAKDVEQILCLVENYVFRRAVCGIPTNSLNKTFANLYQRIDLDNYLESLQVAFLRMGSYKRFPTDQEFINELQTKDVYNFRGRNYLLDRLENYQRKERVLISEYTIEHVMPQNPELSESWQLMLGEEWQQVQQTYLHTLGNLTLTAYNSELSDRPFSDKKSIKGGFDDSPIRLNESVRQVEEWNENAIKQRAESLAGKACKIWFAPNVSQETLEKYQQGTKEAEQYTIEHYENLRGDIYELYLSLKQRVLNIDASVYYEYKKRYVSFKSSTNFVDVIPQASRLLLTLNMPYPELIDPTELSRDVTGIGRWGNGDVQVGLSNVNELELVMELIQQSFDYQMES